MRGKKINYTKKYSSQHTVLIGKEKARKLPIFYRIRDEVYCEARTCSTHFKRVPTLEAGLLVPDSGRLARVVKLPAGGHH
jgi:hypothetical protein